MKPRPKFAVGEEVNCVYENNPNVERTEVLKMEYVESVDMICSITRDEWKYTGFLYYLSWNDGENSSMESKLNKLPPEERTQWEDCAWQPEEVVEKFL